MEVFKIVCVGIVGGLIFAYLKGVNSELSTLSAIATGLVILLLSVSYIVDTVKFFTEISQKTGIDSSIFVIVVKIIVISYLIDFSTNLCEDIGVKSIADKLNLGGKLMIFSISIPIFNNLIETITSIIV